MTRYMFMAQGVLQFFVAMGALIVGVMFVIEPSGALVSAPPELLKNSPFTNYVLPGIILFCINGLGQAAGGYLTLRRHRHAGIVGGVFGLGLIIWLFVQVTFIGGGYLIQNVYFAFGVAEVTLAFFIDRVLR